MRTTCGQEIVKNGGARATIVNNIKQVYCPFSFAANIFLHMQLPNNESKHIQREHIIYKCIRMYLCVWEGLCISMCQVGSVHLPVH
jgi:hypothetical protein